MRRAQKTVPADNSKVHVPIVEVPEGSIHRAPQEKVTHNQEFHFYPRLDDGTRNVHNTTPEHSKTGQYLQVRGGDKNIAKSKKIMYVSRPNIKIKKAEPSPR